MMFAYEIKYISEFSYDEVGNDIRVMTAPSMPDASKIIDDYYGDLLISANLTYLDCSSHSMVSLDRIKECFHLTGAANS